MDALRGFVPGLRGNQGNNQPDPGIKSFSRALREVVVDLYMPRGEDGGRHMDRTLMGTTINMAILGCTFVAGVCEMIPIYVRHNSNPDAASQEELQNCGYKVLATVSALAASTYVFQQMIQDRGRQIIRRDLEMLLEGTNVPLPATMEEVDEFLESTDVPLLETTTEVGRQHQD